MQKASLLFTLAQLANYRRLRTSEAEIQTRNISRSCSLADRWLQRRGMGYNFDCKAAFLRAARYATIVPTAFAARALLKPRANFQMNSI